MDKPVVVFFSLLCCYVISFGQKPLTEPALKNDLMGKMLLGTKWRFAQLSEFSNFKVVSKKEDDDHLYIIAESDLVDLDKRFHAKFKITYKKKVLPDLASGSIYKFEEARSIDYKEIIDSDENEEEDDEDQLDDEWETESSEITDKAKAHTNEEEAGRATKTKTDRYGLPIFDNNDLKYPNPLWVGHYPTDGEVMEELIKQQVTIASWRFQSRQDIEKFKIKSTKYNGDYLVITAEANLKDREKAAAYYAQLQVRYKVTAKTQIEDQVFGRINYYDAKALTFYTVAPENKEEYNSGWGMMLISAWNEVLENMKNPPKLKEAKTYFTTCRWCGRKFEYQKRNYERGYTSYQGGASLPSYFPSPPTYCSKKCLVEDKQSK